MLNRIKNFFTSPEPRKDIDFTRSSEEEPTEVSEVQEDENRVAAPSKRDRFTLTLAVKMVNSVKEDALIALRSMLSTDVNLEQALEPQIETILQFLKGMDLGDRMLGILEARPEKVHAIFKDLALILLANFSHEVVKPDEQVSIEELVDRLSWYLINIIGTEFNQADAKVVESEQVLPEYFLQLADHLFSVAIGDKGLLAKYVKTKKEGIVGLFSEKLAAMYGNFDKKMRGVAVEGEAADLSGITPVIKDAVSLLFNSLEHATFERDLDSLMKLTDARREEVEAAVDFLSGQIAQFLPDILPDALKGEGKEKQIAKLMIGQLFANFSNNFLAKEKTTLPRLFQELTAFLGTEIAAHTESNRLEELPAKLLRMMLPQNLSFLHEFIVRRKEFFLEAVDGICHSFQERAHLEVQPFKEQLAQTLNGLEGDKERFTQQLETYIAKACLQAEETLPSMFLKLPEVFRGVGSSLLDPATMRGQWLKKQIHESVQKSMWSLFSHLTEQAKVQGALNVDQVIPTLIQPSVAAVGNLLPGIYEAYKQKKAENDPELQQWLEQRLKGVVEQVTALHLPEDITTSLPIPEQFSEKVHNAIVSQVNQQVTEMFVSVFATYEDRVRTMDPRKARSDVRAALTFPEKRANKQKFMKQMDVWAAQASDKVIALIPKTIERNEKEWLTTQGDKAARTLFYQAIHKIVEKAKVKGANRSDKIIPIALKSILDQNAAILPRIYTEYKDTQAGKTRKERVEWAEIALAELTKGIMADWLPENPETWLPIPDSFRKQFNLHTELNHLFAEFFTSYLEGMDAEGPEEVLEQIREELELSEEESNSFLKQVQWINDQAASAGKQAVRDLFAKLLKDKSPEGQWLLEQTDRTIRKSVLEVVLNVVRTAKAEGAESPDEIFPTALNSLFAQCGASLPDIYATFVAEEKDLAWVLKQLEGTTMAVCQKWLPEGISDSLPIPDAYKGQVMGLIHGQLNQLFAEMFVAYAGHVKTSNPDDLIQAVGGLLIIPDKSNKPLLDIVNAAADFAEDAALEQLQSIVQIQNEWVVEQVKRTVRSGVYQVLLTLLRRAKDDGVTQYDRLMPFIFKELTSFGELKLPTLYHQYKNRKEAGVSERKLNQWVESQFLKISNSFISQFAGRNFIKNLPIPHRFEPALVSGMNGFFAKLFIASVDSMASQEAEEAKLKPFFKGEESEDAIPAVKACHMAGKFTERGIAFAFQENSKAWGEEVGRFLQAELGLGSNRQRNLRQIFEPLFVELGKSGQAPLMKFAGRFVESMLMKFLVSLSENVVAMEENNPQPESLLEQAVLLIIKEVNQHFKILGDNRKQLKRGGFEAVKEAFREQGQLHPGMEEGGREAVFKEWTKRLALLTGMKEESLPVPEFIRSKVWQQMEDKLLPLFMGMVFDVTRNPNTLRTALIAVLKSFSAEFDKQQNKLDLLKKAFTPDGKPEDFAAQEVDLHLFEDELQIDLKKELGEAAYNYVRMHPSVIAGFVLKIKKIQGLVGTTVGQTVREELRNPEDPQEFLKLIDFLNKGLEVVVESVMPCERKEDGKWDYFELDDEGNRKEARLKVPDLKMYFPGPYEKREVEMQSNMANAINRGRLMRGLPNVIGQQADLLLEAFVSAPYNKFAQFCIKVARKIGGRKHGEKFAKGMRIFLWGLRKYVLGPILLALTLPVWLPIKAIIHAVLKRQGRTRARDLDLDIFTNLFFHLYEKPLARFAEHVEDMEP